VSELPLFVEDVEWLDKALSGQLTEKINGDPEADHSGCDDVLVAFLIFCGLNKSAAIYNREREKWWYA